MPEPPHLRSFIFESWAPPRLALSTQLVSAKGSEEGSADLILLKRKLLVNNVLHATVKAAGPHFKIRPPDKDDAFSHGVSTASWGSYAARRRVSGTTIDALRANRSGTEGCFPHPSRARQHAPWPAQLSKMKERRCGGSGTRKPRIGEGPISVFLCFGFF